MKLQNIEQKITRTGAISLAALAIIGIIACFTGAFGIDMSIFSHAHRRYVPLHFGRPVYSGRFLFPGFLPDEYIQAGIRPDGGKQAQKEYCR